MSSEHPSRRQFLIGAGAFVTLGLASGRAETCRRSRRRAGFRASPVSSLRARSDVVRVRQDVASLSEEQLNSLRRGVDAMKALPETDPRSWSFQANIHGTLGAASSPLFNQCEHGTLLFLAWHRGYLYYFERILRQAAGDPNLTLPYWDWTTAPALPAAFRTPADSSNPLYDDSRTMNDGSELPPEIVVDDLDTALNFVPFPPSGPVGFSRSLEASPHGQVHVFVGGNMGSVPTAANDPIFWLHHCNIDRLWNRWLNQGDGRVNPSDAAFLNKQYSLANEEGDIVSWRVSDIIGSAQLGYRYDNVPNPAPVLATLKAAAEREGPRSVRAASTIKEEPPAALESKPLGFKPETVKLHVAAQHAAALKAAAQGARKAKSGKLLLQIEGLAVAEVPNFTYAVYLNLADDKAPADEAKPHYVGTVNFFGKGAAGKKHAHDAEKTFSQTFDVTSVVARLQEKGRWRPDALSVTLRPLTPIPPKGKEEALRKRSEKSAEKAKISYQRINLVVSP